MNRFKNTIKLQWVLLTIVTLCVTQFSVLPVEAANSRNGSTQEIPRFETKVVDINCELAGNCPSNCNDAKPQLELTYKKSSGISGVAHDPVDFCNQQVNADELKREHPGVRFFVAQIIRDVPHNKWRRSNRPMKNGSAGSDFDDSKIGSWFRLKPDVKRLSESDDLLDLGQKKDQVYFNTK